MSTLIASTALVHSTCYSFYHMVSVKFYCDVITRSCLQLINTSIDKTSCLFSGTKKKKKGSDRSWMAQWMNLQQIKKFVNHSRLHITCEKSEGLDLAELGLTAGWLAGHPSGRRNLGKACNFKSLL